MLRGGLWRGTRLWLEMRFEATRNGATEERATKRSKYMRDEGIHDVDGLTQATIREANILCVNCANFIWSEI